MKLKLSPGYIIAFLCLLLLMMELHEIVHITTGYLVCGCWGRRDFNVWNLCAGCDEKSGYGWIATIAGPLFSFIMMWVGRQWMKTKDIRKKSIGFSMVFANIPFGRLSTVMMGGGDEMVVTRHFLQGHVSRSSMIILCSIILLLIIIFPVATAVKTIRNKRSWLYIAGFLTLPMAFLLVYLLGAMNTLLTRGFLLQSGIMGTPILISIHTVLICVVFLLLKKKLILKES